MIKWGISGATILTPSEILTNGNIIVNDDRIQGVTDRDNALRGLMTIEVDGAVLLPGLINSHDHLLGTYYPKVGSGPYENWLPWDNDLKSSPVYEERQQVENRDLYLLGAYRNLVSGVTTVSDHIPHFVSEPYADILPMKIIEEYALAHSIASFALAWGEGIEVEYKKAVERGIPFITHIAEGFDSETIEDVKNLDRRGGLGEFSVLIHGLAFSDDDIALIKKKGASVVWCADSNMFMFNRTANVREILDQGVNLCIGTDSPMSGGQNLLYELKYDKKLYKKLYDEDLPDELIIKMVTENPAKAFKLNRNGQIKAGYTADFTVFSKIDKNPYSSVVRARLRDVLLVVIDGMPVYGSAEFKELFDSLDIDYQVIVIDDSEKMIIGDLLGLLKRINRAVGFKKEFPFLPVQLDS